MIAGNFIRQYLLEKTYHKCSKRQLWLAKHSINQSKVLISSTPNHIQHPLTLHPPPTQQPTSSNHHYKPILSSFQHKIGSNTYFLQVRQYSEGINLSLYLKNLQKSCGFVGQSERIKQIYKKILLVLQEMYAQHMVIDGITSRRIIINNKKVEILGSWLDQHTKQRQLKHLSPQKKGLDKSARHILNQQNIQQLLEIFQQAYQTYFFKVIDLKPTFEKIIQLIKLSSNIEIQDIMKLLQAQQPSDSENNNKEEEYMILDITLRNQIDISKQQTEESVRTTQVQLKDKLIIVYLITKYLNESMRIQLWQLSNDQDSMSKEKILYAMMYKLEEVPEMFKYSISSLKDLYHFFVDLDEEYLQLVGDHLFIKFPYQEIQTESKESDPDISGGDDEQADQQQQIIESSTVEKSQQIDRQQLNLGLADKYDQPFLLRPRPHDEKAMIKDSSQFILIPKGEFQSNLSQKLQEIQQKLTIWIHLKEYIQEFHEIGQQFSRIAANYLLANNYNKAELYLKKANQIFSIKKSDHQYQLLIKKMHLSIIYHNFAIFYQKTSNPDEALSCCREAIRLSLELDHKRHAVSSLNLMIGILMVYFGDYTESQEYINLAIRRLDIGSETLEMANLYHNYAILLLETNQIENAIKQFNKALLIFVRVGIKEQIAYCYFNLINCYLINLDFSSAFQLWKKSEPFWRNELKKEAIVTFVSMFKVMASKNGIEKAIKLISQEKEVLSLKSQKEFPKYLHRFF